MSDRELLELAAKVPGVQELIDDLRATRTAIVRAAAEIGRQMQEGQEV